MAEATVESPPSTSKFFCHACLSEVHPNIPAYTCSRCNSGFIEEMERPAVPEQPPNDATNGDPAYQFAEMLSNAFLDPFRHIGGPGTVWGTRHRYNTRQARQMARGSEDVDENEDDDMRGVAPNAVFQINSGDLHQPGQQTFHGIINYVIQRLGNNDLGGRAPFAHLHANPGDYAWGTGGLDAIISQLLNQLEGSGAPPAQKEKIENLPKIIIEQSHIDDALQCSICMDDFELAQEVKKLPCGHLYHSECIVKWLEMHGTCPVCRKDLNGEDVPANDIDFPTVFPPPLSGEGHTETASSSSSSSSSISMGPSTSSSYSMEDNQ